MVDGNLTVLAIADPNKKQMIDYIRSLPSRQLKLISDEQNAEEKEN